MLGYPTQYSIFDIQLRKSQKRFPENFPPEVSRYFYTLVILNLTFETITVPQIDFSITS